jgi:hypothetical protein
MPNLVQFVSFNRGEIQGGIFGYHIVESAPVQFVSVHLRQIAAANLTEKFKHPPAPIVREIRAVDFHTTALGKPFDFLTNRVMPIKNCSPDIESEGFDGTQINSHNASSHQTMVWRRAYGLIDALPVDCVISLVRVLCPRYLSRNQPPLIIAHRVAYRSTRVKDAMPHSPHMEGFIYDPAHRI